MTYVLLALLGALLATGGVLWYYFHKTASEAASNTALTNANGLQADKIKTLDDRIVDSEYARRIADKKRAKEITDAATAAGLLGKAGHDDGTSN